MKIVGIAFHWRGTRPIEEGFLPIDEFTGILGRNDSGKSTLLSHVHGLLEGKPTLDGIVFAEIGADRYKELLKYCLSDLIEGEAPPGRYYGTGESRSRGRWWTNVESLTANSLESAQFPDEPDLIEMWENHLRASFAGSEPESWNRVIDFLSQNSKDTGKYFVAFEPSSGLEEHRDRDSWNLLLCLPPLRSVPPDVQAALEMAGVLDPEWAARRRNLRPISSSQRRDHLGGPVVVAPLGQTSLPLLPRPLFPRSQDAVMPQLERAISDCTAQLRWADFLVKLVTNEWSLEESIEDIAPDPWVEHRDEDCWELAGDVPILCRKLESAIAAVLPRPISEKYRVRVRVRPPENWSESHLRIELEPVDPAFFPGSFDDSNAISIDELAEGFRLWVNISILFATHMLQLAAANLALSNTHLESWVNFGVSWFDDAEETETVVELKRELESVVSLVRDLEQELRLTRLAEWWFLDSRSGETSEMDAAELARGQLFLIDEPERFLHPKLRREFAAWLEDFSSVGIPALVATHSVPFMGIKRNASYTYLLREGNAATQFLPISPGELTEMGLAAEELGLDRGELLALISTVLWVEGEMDRAVLLNAFPAELKESGVLVVPMGGYRHAKAQAILETSLMRVSGANVAVWLDGVDRDYVERVTTHPEIAEDEARRAGAQEPQIIARLVAEASKIGRTINPIGVDSPGYDVFDLLDESVIRERFPEFPGHKEARSRFEEKVTSGGAKPGEWKNYWQKWFGISVDEQTCGELAAEMRRTDRITEPLRQVVDHVRSLPS